MIINNFVIDRIKRGMMLSSTDGSVLWSINQITNPTLTVSSETVDAVDALGVPIATFNRAKTAEFSAENSLFDLGLLAAQSGTTVDESTADNTYNVPVFDDIKVTAADTATLSKTPADGTLKYVYIQNGDGTLGEKFTVGSSASGNTVSVSDKVITFASGKAPVGTYIFAMYETEVNGTSGSQASRVINKASEFPKAGRFLLEAIGCDVCDQTKVVAAYIEFPVAKLQSDFDYTFATDSTHSFSLKAMQDYCDPDKLLFKVIIPE